MAPALAPPQGFGNAVVYGDLIEHVLEWLRGSRAEGIFGIFSTSDASGVAGGGGGSDEGEGEGGGLSGGRKRASLQQALHAGEQCMQRELSFVRFNPIPSHPVPSHPIPIPSPSHPHPIHISSTSHPIPSQRELSCVRFKDAIERVGGGAGVATPPATADTATVFAASWNLGEGMPSAERMQAWLPLGRDVYAIGLQELPRDRRVTTARHVRARP